MSGVFMYGRKLLRVVRNNETNIALRILTKDPKSARSSYSSDAPHSGWHALHWAAYNQNYPLIEALILADPTTLTQKNSEGLTPIQVAARNECWHAVQSIAEICARFVKGNLDEANLGSALLAAARHNKTSSALALIKAGAKSTFFSKAKDHHGWHPLHWAAYNEDLHLIEALIRSDPNTLIQKNSEGLTPIQVAARNGCWPAVQSIAEICARFVKGNLDEANLGSALLAAARHNETHSALSLINAGSKSIFSSRDKDHNGWYPLHWAIYNRNIDLIKALIKADHSLHVKNAARQNPLQLARHYEYNDCIKLLTEKSSQTLRSPNVLEIKKSAQAQSAPTHLLGDKKEVVLAPKPALVQDAKAIITKEESKTVTFSEKKEKDEITILYSLIESGNLKELEARLKTKLNDSTFYNEIMSNRAREGLTLAEFAAIKNQLEIFSFLINYQSYHSEFDSSFYIIGPKKTNELLKKYSQSDSPLKETLRKAIAWCPRNYKELFKNPKTDLPHLDSTSLRDLIITLASGKLHDNTLTNLAKKELFKETVLAFLNRLSLKGQHDKNALAELDDILLWNQEHRQLEKFFQISRGLFQSEPIKAFNLLEKEWNQQYRERMGFPTKHIQEAKDDVDSAFRESDVASDDAIHYTYALEIEEPKKVSRPPASVIPIGLFYSNAEKKQESSLTKPLVDKEKDRDVSDAITSLEPIDISDAIPSSESIDLLDSSSLQDEDQERLSPAILDQKDNKRDVLSVIPSLQEIELSSLSDVPSEREQKQVSLPTLLDERASSNRYAKFGKSGETVRNLQENAEMLKGVKTAIEMSRIR
jgi:ankyrin repeat protein